MNIVMLSLIFEIAIFTSLNNVKLIDEGVKFSYLAKHMEEGYPGNLQISCVYKLNGNGLNIEYSAETDKETVINITNHSYFNLDGNNQVRVVKRRVAMKIILNIVEESEGPHDPSICFSYCAS